MSRTSVPIVPRNPDKPLPVVVLGRLSQPKETEDQTQESLESSVQYATRRFKELYDGPIELRQLAEQESGLVVDRWTIVEAERLVAAKKCDVVIIEDLGRIFRNPRHMMAFVQDCVDAGSRVISFADNLDTADENWQFQLAVAAVRHGLYVPDAQRKVRRQATDAFHSGGQVAKVKFGHFKVSREDAKSGTHGPVGLRIAKDPNATPIIKQMIETLKRERSWLAVSTKLNDQSVAPGPYVKSGKWTPAIAKDLLTDTILRGDRHFRTILYERKFRDGRPERKPNPNGPETERHPELAHLTEKEFDELQVLIGEIEAKNGADRDQPHPRRGVPRKDAIFPRQHAKCAICGGTMYAYDVDQVKCENAHEHGDDQCWNHVQLNMDVAQSKCVAWLLEQADQVTGFREFLVDFTWQYLQDLQRECSESESDRLRSIADLKGQAAALAKAIARGGELDALLEELKCVNRSLEALREEHAVSPPSNSVIVECCSRERVADRFDDVLLHLVRTSSEFGALMRKIMPKLEIVPVQAIDSGLVRPRARITLRVGALVPEAGDAHAVSELHDELDLFEPAKHFRYMRECSQLKKENPKWSQIDIAAELTERHGDYVSYMTVKRAFDLARRMETEGLTEPYRVLTEKPTNASRWIPRP